MIDHSSYAYDERVGLTLKQQGRSVDLMGYGITYPLSRNEAKDFCGTYLTFLQNLGRVSKRTSLEFAAITPDEETYNDRAQSFTRYVTRSDYETYIKHGVFRFCGLASYRDTNDPRASDSQEGFSFNFVHGRGKDAFLVSRSFKWYLVLCGSLEADSAQLAKQFGDVRLRLRDPELFCQTVCGKIGALSYKFGRVRYSNPKLVEMDVLDAEFASPHDLFSRSFFSLLTHRNLESGLFLKPSDYSKEREVRLAFEMPRDVSSPIIVRDPSFLTHFDVIV